MLQEGRAPHQAVLRSARRLQLLILAEVQAPGPNRRTARNWNEEEDLLGPAAPDAA